MVASLCALDVALRNGGLKGDVDTAVNSDVECTQLSLAVQTADRLPAKSSALCRTLVWAKAVLDLRLAVASGNWDRVAALVDAITMDSSAGGCRDGPGRRPRAPGPGRGWGQWHG